MNPPHWDEPLSGRQPDDAVPPLEAPDPEPCALDGTLNEDALEPPPLARELGSVVEEPCSVVEDALLLAKPDIAVELAPLVPLSLLALVAA